MYQLTGSSAMVGYIYLAEFVPMVVLAFVGGAMADFLDKRKMLRLTEIGQTAVTAILLGNSLLPKPQIWVLFVAVAMHAGLAAIQRPAFESFIQKVIPVEMMSAVMALNSIRYSVGAIVSPAVAAARIVDLVERTITHRSDKFAEPDAQRDEVEAGWRHALALHERHVDLRRALEAAERDWQHDGNETALARICEIQRQIACCNVSGDGDPGSDGAQGGR